MSVARTSVRRFATSARLRNTTTQGQVYTPRSEPQPVPQQQQQPYTPPPQPQVQPQPQPQPQVQPQPVHVGTAGNVPVEKPVGGLRGGIVGFLLGFSAATGLGIYYLQQDTKEAQGLLTSSVEELTRDTQRITTHLDRLQTTEKDLAALRKDAVTKDELVKLRAELKKAYDGLHLENLDLRAHVWGIEQDLQKVAKEESIRI